MIKKTAEFFRGKIKLHNWEVGEHTYGLPQVQGVTQAKLIIGRYCSIARDVKISLGLEHRVDWVSTYPFSAFIDEWGPTADVPGHPMSKGDVVIGNDVWIGGYVHILSGLTIGDGAVIGRGSVVNVSIPPYCIAMGNPARVFKKRFSDGVIERLLKLRWWDWPDDRVKEAIPYLCAQDIEAFLGRYEGYVPPPPVEVPMRAKWG